MRCPESWWGVVEPGRSAVVPATPVVYPVDDQVKEGLLGPDGEPLTEGTRRKNPIGFHRAP